MKFLKNFKILNLKLRCEGTHFCCCDCTKILCILSYLMWLMLMLMLSFILLALLSIGCFWSCWSCPLWCGCYLHVGDVILYVDMEVVDDVFLMFSFLVLLFCSWVAVVVDVILFWHRCCCWSNIKGCCCCSCSWWVGISVGVERLLFFGGVVSLLLVLCGWWYWVVVCVVKVNVVVGVVEGFDGWCCWG